MPACCVLQDNKWRLNTLQHSDLLDVFSEWTIPELIGDEIPVEYYQKQCKELKIRNKQKIEELLFVKQTSLDLSKSFVGRVGILPIFGVLSLLNNLKEINLSHSQLESPIITILAKILSRHPSLESVDVSYNPFSSLGVQALLEAAVFNSNLSVITLTGVDAVSSLVRRLNERLQLNQRQKQHS